MHALRVRWSAYKSSRRLRKAWDELPPNTEASAAYDACCGLINGTDMLNRELRGFIEALNAATDDVLTTADATELHQSLQRPDEFVEMCLAAAFRNDRYGQIVCQSLTMLSKDAAFAARVLEVDGSRLQLIKLISQWKDINTARLALQLVERVLTNVPAPNQFATVEFVAVLVRLLAVRDHSISSSAGKILNQLVAPTGNAAAADGGVHNDGGGSMFSLIRQMGAKVAPWLVSWVHGAQTEGDKQDLIHGPAISMNALDFPPTARQLHVHEVSLQAATPSLQTGCDSMDGISREDSSANVDSVLRGMRAALDSDKQGFEMFTTLHEMLMRHAVANERFTQDNGYQQVTCLLQRLFVSSEQRPSADVAYQCRSAAAAMEELCIGSNPDGLVSNMAAFTSLCTLSVSSVCAMAQEEFCAALVDLLALNPLNAAAFSLGGYAQAVEEFLLMPLDVATSSHWSLDLWLHHISTVLKPMAYLSACQVAKSRDSVFALFRVYGRFIGFLGSSPGVAGELVWAIRAAIDIVLDAVLQMVDDIDHALQLNMNDVGLQNPLEQAPTETMASQANPYEAPSAQSPIGDSPHRPFPTVENFVRSIRTLIRLSSPTGQSAWSGQASVVSDAGGSELASGLSDWTPSSRRQAVGGASSSTSRAIQLLVRWLCRPRAVQRTVVDVQTAWDLLLEVMFSDDSDSCVDQHSIRVAAQGLVALLCTTVSAPAQDMDADALDRLLAPLNSHLAGRSLDSAPPQRQAELALILQFALCCVQTVPGVALRQFDPKIGEEVVIVHPFVAASAQSVCAALVAHGTLEALLDIFERSWRPADVSVGTEALFLLFSCAATQSEVAHRIILQRVTQEHILGWLSGVIPTAPTHVLGALLDLCSRDSLQMSWRLLAHSDEVDQAMGRIRLGADSSYDAGGLADVQALVQACDPQSITTAILALLARVFSGIEDADILVHCSVFAPRMQWMTVIQSSRGHRRSFDSATLSVDRRTGSASSAAGQRSRRSTLSVSEDSDGSKDSPDDQDDVNLTSVSIAVETMWKSVVSRGFLLHSDNAVALLGALLTASQNAEQLAVGEILRCALQSHPSNCRRLVSMRFSSFLFQLLPLVPPRAASTVTSCIASLWEYSVTEADLELISKLLQLDATNATAAPHSEATNDSTASDIRKLLLWLLASAVENYGVVRPTNYAHVQAPAHELTPSVVADLQKPEGGNFARSGLTVVAWIKCTAALPADWAVVASLDTAEGGLTSSASLVLRQNPSSNQAELRVLVQSPDGVQWFSPAVGCIGGEWHFIRWTATATSMTVQVNDGSEVLLTEQRTHSEAPARSETSLSETDTAIVSGIAFLELVTHVSLFGPAKQLDYPAEADSEQSRLISFVGSTSGVTVVEGTLSHALSASLFRAGLIEPLRPTLLRRLGIDNKLVAIVDPLQLTSLPCDEELVGAGNFCILKSNADTSPAFGYAFEFVRAQTLNGAKPADPPLTGRPREESRGWWRWGVDHAEDMATVLARETHLVHHLALSLHRPRRELRAETLDTLLDSLLLLANAFHESTVAALRIVTAILRVSNEIVVRFATREGFACIFSLLDGMASELARDTLDALFELTSVELPGTDDSADLTETTLSAPGSLVFRNRLALELVCDLVTGGQLAVEVEAWAVDTIGDHVAGSPINALVFRESVGFAWLLDLLPRTYASTTTSSMLTSENLGLLVQGSTATTTSHNPTRSNAMLRPAALRFIRSFVFGHAGREQGLSGRVISAFTVDELQAALDFVLVHVNTPNDICADLLNLILEALMAADGMRLLALYKQIWRYDYPLFLLSSANENVRLCGLKLLGFYLIASGSKSQRMFERNGGITCVIEKLTQWPVNDDVCAVLLHMVGGTFRPFADAARSPSPSQRATGRAAGDDSRRRGRPASRDQAESRNPARSLDREDLHFDNPAMFEVLFHLLALSSDNSMVSRVLTDVERAFTPACCAYAVENLTAVLSCRYWLRWLEHFQRVKIITDLAVSAPPTTTAASDCLSPSMVTATVAASSVSPSNHQWVHSFQTLLRRILLFDMSHSWKSARPCLELLKMDDVRPFQLAVVQQCMDGIAVRDLAQEPDARVPVNIFKNLTAMLDHLAQNGPLLPNFMVHTIRAINAFAEQATNVLRTQMSDAGLFDARNTMALLCVRGSGQALDDFAWAIAAIEPVLGSIARRNRFRLCAGVGRLLRLYLMAGEAGEVALQQSYARSLQTVATESDDCRKALFRIVDDRETIHELLISLRLPPSLAEQLVSSSWLWPKMQCGNLSDVSPDESLPPASDALEAQAKPSDREGDPRSPPHATALEGAAERDLRPSHGLYPSLQAFSQWINSAGMAHHRQQIWDRLDQHLAQSTKSEAKTLEKETRAAAKRAKAKQDAWQKHVREHQRLAAELWEGAVAACTAAVQRDRQRSKSAGDERQFRVLKGGRRWQVMAQHAEASCASESGPEELYQQLDPDVDTGRRLWNNYCQSSLHAVAAVADIELS